MAPETRLIGLMMIRNEVDVLDDTLAHLTQFFDRIYVLDGTAPHEEYERSLQILARYDEIKLVQRDQDTAGPFPIRDGARQYLLKAARAEHGTGHWIGILHGDEYFTRDPRLAIRRVDPAVHPVVQVRLCHFFLHSTDRDRWQCIKDLPVNARVTHYMWPGTPEDRFFYDYGSHDYEPSRHRLVVPYPHGVKRLLLDNFVVKQFNYRSPEQMLSRARQRLDSHWQPNHYRHIVDDDLRFVDSLHVPGYPPCGYDNRNEPCPEKRSRPRCTTDFPLPSYDSLVTPIFIGGPGRSGSTVLKQLLGRHRSVVALNWESKFLSFPDGLFDLANQYSHDKMARFLENMANANPTTYPEHECREVKNWLFRARNGDTTPLDTFPVELEYLQHGLQDDSVPLAAKQKLIQQFTHFLFDRVALRSGATHWVEQTPKNMFWAADMLTSFPNAHFLFVRRDPRDVVTSLLRQWWGPDDVEGCVEYYRARHNAWRQMSADIHRRQLDSRMTEVRFEALVENTEPTLTRVFDRLGLQPTHVSIDPTCAHIGQWEHQLDDAQKRHLCAALRDELIELGYT